MDGWMEMRRESVLRWKEGGEDGLKRVVIYNPTPAPSNKFQIQIEIFFGDTSLSLGNISFWSSPRFNLIVLLCPPFPPSFLISPFICTPVFDVNLSYLFFFFSRHALLF
jgi:hypothetical protein